MDQHGFMMDSVAKKEELRFASMVLGEPYVTTTGLKKMPMLFVDNLDTQIQVSSQMHIHNIQYDYSISQMPRLSTLPTSVKALFQF